MFNFSFHNTQPKPSGLWFTFFTQGNNVYKDLSPQVKNTIQKDTFNPTISVKFPKLFQPCPGKVKICAKRINQNLYKCKDCILTQNSCLCSDCFDFSKHKNHKYSCSSSKGYCDCGISTRWKPEGFCDSHGKQSLEWTLSPQIRQKFTHFFTNCFKLFFELINLSLNNELNIKNDAAILTTKEYGDNIFIILSGLNEGSPEYQELTYQVLMTKVQVKKQTKSILQFLFELPNPSLLKNDRKFIFSMQSHDEFVYESLKMIFEKFPTQELLEKARFAFDILKQVGDFLPVLKKLAQNDIIIYNNFTEKQTIRPIFHFYCEKVNRISPHKEKLQNQSILLDVWKSLHRKQLFDLTKISEQQFQIILQDVHMNSQFTLEILKVLKNMMEKYCTPITNMVTLLNLTIKNLYLITDGDEEKVVAYFWQMGLSEENIKTIAENYFINIVENQQTQIKDIPMIILMKLLLKMGEGHKFFVQLWEKILKEQNDDSIFVQFTSNFLKYFVGEELSNTLNAYKHHRNKRQQIIGIMEKKFKQFLYMRKYISKDVIVNMKKSKLLFFPNAGPIIHQVTQYNENNNEFKYVSPENHSRTQLYLMNILEEKLPAICFTEEDDRFFSISEDQVQLIELLITSGFQVFQNVLHSVKSQTLHDIFYVRFLNAVVVDKLLSGENKIVRSYLIEKKEAILENPQTTTEAIDQLLGINRKQLQKQENIDEVGQEAKLKKMKKKKVLLNEKYAGMQKKILQNFQQQLEGEKDEKEHVCIICKEGEKQYCKMYYLGKTKKSTIYNSLFSALNGDILMDSCFHTIHDTCFSEYVTEEGSTCPLCTKFVNCVLPLPNIHDEEYYRFWKNRIIYLFIKDSIHIDKTPMFLLKGLVLRCGISFTFNLEVNEMSKKKLNYFIQELMTSYELMGESNRNKFSQQIQKLIVKSEENSNKIVKLIEKIFFNLFHCLLKKEIYANLETDLIDLQKILSPNQFLLIKTSVQEVLQKQISLPMQQINNSKEMLFNLSLPETAEEMTHYREKCEKCNSLRGWYCVNCRVTFCYECDMINGHKNQFHRQFFLIIILFSGRFRMIRKNQSDQFHLYVNYFMENWDGEDDPSQYFLNKEKYRKNLANMLLEE